MMVAGIATLVLIAALALGWHSPRPGRPPDWKAPEIPRTLRIPPGSASVALLQHHADNFTLEVIAQPLGRPDAGFCDYGVVYRAQNPAQYYAFTVGSDGYYAVTRVEGEDVVPLITGQQFPHVKRGDRPNRLLVSCAGPSCSFRINDEYAATVEDDRWLWGEVGLWGRSANGEGVVEFSALRMWVDQE